MTRKKECGCCMKNSYNTSKCFVNNLCSWKSCYSCITQQIKLKQDMDIIYLCPNCRKESIFNKHTRFTKFCKQNRGALIQMCKLQKELLLKMEDRIQNINYYSSLQVLWESPVQDMAGNILNETHPDENDIEIGPHLPAVEIDDIGMPEVYSLSPTSSSS